MKMFNASKHRLLQKFNHFIGENPGSRNVHVVSIVEQILVQVGAVLIIVDTMKDFWASQLLHAGYKFSVVNLEVGGINKNQLDTMFEAKFLSVFDQACLPCQFLFGLVLVIISLESAV